DPDRVMHQLDHPLGLALEFGAELGYRSRTRLEDGVAKLPNLLQRRRTPLTRLGIQVPEPVLGRTLGIDRLPLVDGRRIRRFGHCHEFNLVRSFSSETGWCRLRSSGQEL